MHAKKLLRLGTPYQLKDIKNKSECCPQRGYVQQKNFGQFLLYWARYSQVFDPLKVCAVPVYSPHTANTATVQTLAVS